MSPHERAPANAKISISLSKEMLEALDSLAESEGRSRSNMLQRIIAGQLAEHRQLPFGLVAETKEPQYGKD